MEISHGVVPCLARVSVGLPSVVLSCLSPIGNAEALKESSGVSVESHITHALKDGVGMEVLSVHMHHDVWLLVEFVLIDILNSEASFSSLFDVEAIGDECEVRVDKTQSI